MIPISEQEIDRLIAEDVGLGDLTTRSLGIGGASGRISFAARDPMVASGTEEAARILARLGATPRLHIASGQAVTPGTLLLDATGPAAALHAGWKVAQTLLEWSSGIASSVHDIMQAARAAAPGIVLACTRKSAPGTRALSIKSVLAGGGVMHRIGLSETLVVFAEHRAFLPDADMAAIVARLRAAAPERSIVVEVGSEAEALDAARAGADVVQLEKFPPESVAAVRAAFTAGGLRARLAPGGGVNVRNAAAYAAAGADILVSSAPFQAPPRDVQVRITSD